MTLIALKASTNQLRLVLSILSPESSKTKGYFSFCLALQPVIWTEKKKNQYFWDSPNVDTPSLKPLKIWGCHLSNPSRFGAEALFWLYNMLYLKKKKQNTQRSLDGLSIVDSECKKKLQQLSMVWKNLLKNCEMGGIVFLALSPFSVSFTKPASSAPTTPTPPPMTFSCYSSGPCAPPILTPIPQSLPVGSFCFRSSR